MTRSSGREEKDDVTRDRDNFGLEYGHTTENEVQFFREMCPIGKTLNCMVFQGAWDGRDSHEVPKRCLLLHKGKDVAVTTQGIMQWKMLTIWNKALLRSMQAEYGWGNRRRRRK